MLMNQQSLLKPSRTLALESTTFQAAVLLLLTTVLPAVPLFVVNADRYVFGGVIASMVGSAFGVVFGTLLRLSRGERSGPRDPIVRELVRDRHVRVLRAPARL